MSWEATTCIWSRSKGKSKGKGKGKGKNRIDLFIKVL